MSQRVIPGREYLDRSGNGMQGTNKTGKTQAGKRRSSAGAQGKTSYSSQRNASGVDCDITEGARRVSQLMNGERKTSAADVMFNESDGAYVTGSVRQAAVDKVKMSQTEAVMTEEETEYVAGEDELQDDGEKTLEYLERMMERIKKSREANSSKKNAGKRALNYNYRKVSGAIMRARSATQANNALTSAKSTLSNLSRKSGSKLYDAKELEIAINHAKKMIRTARKKVQNIKAEERQKKLDTDVSNTQERQHNIIKRQQRGGAKAENAKIEKEMMRLKKMLKQNREQRKNSHRRDENQDLLIADMEYLRRKIDLMRQERMVEKIESTEARQAVISSTVEGTAESGAAADASSGETAATESQSAGTGANMSAADVASSGFEATV